jgi:CubicO group peptidase (beta-lactamase class C family)
MFINRKRTISAILITVILFLAACSAVEEPPVVEYPPEVENNFPVFEDVDENLLDEDGEVEYPEDEELEEVEINEEIEESIVFPRGDTELELLIYSFIDEMVGQGFAGTAISVFTRDEIILELTYGFKNMEEQIPIDSETVFGWGSITKLLTWVSVMQLYERGQLDIHADLFTYLPREDFSNIVYPTTVYHLMRHSAGFIGYWGDFNVVQRTLVTAGARFSPFEECIRWFSESGALVQQSQPGERFVYSNAYSTALAAYIVQRVTDMPFYEYVHYNIFAPLGMQSTSLYTDLSDNEWVREQRDKIIGYTSSNALPVQMLFQYSLYPAVSAVGTISDMMKFAQALLLDENGESALFQNPETLRTIYPSLEVIESAETDEAAEGIIFHYGFMVFPDRNLFSNRFAFRDSSERIIGHSGGTSSFRSILWVDIDRGVGMVMSENTNYGLSSAEGFYADIAEIILKSVGA